MAFDTLTSAVLLPGPNCQNCGNRKQYNPSNSSTSTEGSRRFTVLDPYHTSSTEGKLYTDIVSIGDLSVKDQAIGAADYYDRSITSLQGPDGKLGLGFQTTNAGTPFFQSLISSGALDSPVFGLKVPAFGSQGELLLGGTNSAYYKGDFTTVPVLSSPIQWEISTSIKLDGKVAVTIPRARIGAGISTIVTDRHTLENFFKQIPGSRMVSMDEYSYPCDTDLNLSITVGGRDFRINKQTFDIRRVPGDQCVGGITSRYGLAPGDPWILGEVFLQNVYTAFNGETKEIGFAELKLI